MSDTVLDRIPEYLRDAVKAALSASFGSSSVEAHQPMTGGASGALTLRITVKGRDHVLRVEARRSPLRNPISTRACGLRPRRSRAARSRQSRGRRWSCSARCVSPGSSPNATHRATKSRWPARRRVECMAEKGYATRRHPRSTGLARESSECRRERSSRRSPCH